MSYFRELPDIEYQSQLPTKNSSLNYVRVKNLFRRVKLRDDLQNVFTLFNKYQIKDGERPDNIAETLYGSPDLDWVVLLSANIINVRDSWPLSDRDLYNFVEEKYGLEGMYETKYYQTGEVRTQDGTLILPAGKIVDKDFTIINPDNPFITLNPVISISYYDYEIDKNNKKRTIYILKPEYLQQYIDDIRSIMYYEKSSRYINTKLIRTENTLNTSP
jgi:hypothetical protein